MSKNCVPVSDQSHAESLKTTVTVADHELVGVIGRGAYGEVWLAWHTRLGVARAVKIVRRDQFSEARPFQREFSGIQKYEPISRGHSNLVSILHVGGGEDYFYYVMELADDCNVGHVDIPKTRNRAGHASRLPPGSSIGESGQTPDLLYSPDTVRSQLKRHGVLPIDRCVQIGRALASGLAHLHAHQLVHRDVKPSNVIFVDGIPKLADIGLVAGVDDARSFVGTEGYIPPEGAGTPSADCYSLGKLLYELSAGHDRTAWPEPPADLATRPDRERLLELNAILHKACAPQQGERYRTAEEMRFELDLLQCGGSVKRQRARQRRRQFAWKAGLSVLILTLLVFGAIILVRQLPDRNDRSKYEEVNKLVEQGNYLVLSATPDEQRRAADRFKRAMEIDPKFVPAQFGLVRAYWSQYTGDHSPELDSNVRKAAARLMEIAPDRAEAWAAAASVKWIDHRWRDALAHVRKATQLRAGSKEGRGAVHDLCGCYLICTGYTDEALNQFQLAERECGADPTIQQHLGFPYFVKGDFDEALMHFQMATDSESRYEGGHYWASRAYVEKGDFEKAINELEESERVIGAHKGERFYDDLRQAFRQGGPTGYWNKRLQTEMGLAHPDSYAIASLLARLGKWEKAYEQLEEADRKGEIYPGNLAFDPSWDRHDGRFKEIARKNGLTLY